MACKGPFDQKTIIDTLEFRSKGMFYTVSFNPLKIESYSKNDFKILGRKKAIYKLNNRIEINQKIFFNYKDAQDEFNNKRNILE